jgi:GNAT superfamily N-acetyltransferase
MTVVVRKASPDDAARLAAALARAFQDDPVMTWLLPSGRARGRQLRTIFGLELRYLHLPNGQVYTTSDVSGGALWAPPHGWRTPPARLVRAMPRLALTLGRRLPAALRTLSAVERLHPSEPHWYLALLGTEPTSQRTGVGSALLAPVLERCDHDGVPAYLESSKESNIAFYTRHGFEVTGTVDLPGGGPRMWPMWREPRA